MAKPMEGGRMNQTKKSIQASFMKLYNRYDYDKISVKDLCANTPVARTTFYSYYNNIDEVKWDIEDKIIRGLLEVTESVSQGNLPDMDFMIFLDTIQIYIEENWEWIYAFVVKQVNHRFIDKWKQAICGNFQKRYPEKQNIQNYGLISEIVASATIGAYTYWMKYPDRVKKGDMKDVIRKTLDAVVQII